MLDSSCQAMMSCQLLVKLLLLDIQHCCDVERYGIRDGLAYWKMQAYMMFRQVKPESELTDHASTSLSEP